MSYQKKYLKYKEKYLNLKKIGGSEFNYQIKDPSGNEFKHLKNPYILLDILTQYDDCSAIIDQLSVVGNKFMWYHLNEHKNPVRITPDIFSHINENLGKYCDVSGYSLQQKLDCNMYIKKCKLKGLYEEFLKKKYTDEEINIETLNEILLLTIKNSENDLQRSYKQDFLRSLGAELKIIKSFAFANNTNLTNVTIPEGVTIIQSNAFINCNLSNLTIPSTVTTIETSTFANNINLTNVTIPEGVTIIKSNSFVNCNLTNLTIPSTVTTIETFAFANNINLTNVTIPEGVTIIKSNAFGNCNLTNLTIPSTVTTIETFAFANNKNLTNVTILEGVTTIKSHAFVNCNLSNLTIPSTVTRIETFAFGNSKNLTNVTIPKRFQTTTNSFFNNIDQSKINFTFI
jgi:hypothetical protein